MAKSSSKRRYQDKISALQESANATQEDFDRIIGEVKTIWAPPVHVSTLAGGQAVTLTRHGSMPDLGILATAHPARRMDCGGGVMKTERTSRDTSPYSRSSRSPSPRASTSKVILQTREEFKPPEPRKRTSLQPPGGGRLDRQRCHSDSNLPYVTLDTQSNVFPLHNIHGAHVSNGMPSYTSPQPQEHPVEDTRGRNILIRETVIRSASPRRNTVGNFYPQPGEGSGGRPVSLPHNFAMHRKMSHPSHIEIVVNPPDEELGRAQHPPQPGGGGGVPNTVSDPQNSSYLAGSYRSPGHVPNYSNPGTPESSIGSPASSETFYDISNAEGEIDPEKLDKLLPEEEKEKLMEIMSSLERETADLNLVQDCEQLQFNQNAFTTFTPNGNHGQDHNANPSDTDTGLLEMLSAATIPPDSVTPVPDTESMAEEILKQLQNMN